MVVSADIYLWGLQVGSIFWDDKQGMGIFEYAPDFKERGLEVSPFKMPTSSGRDVFSFPELRSRDQELDTFRGLPGMLADLLPDKYGNALINSWLSAQGRATNSMNPVEMLCYIGKRGMGALEIRPSLKEMSKPSAKIEMESLVNLADRILQERLDFRLQLSPEEEETWTDLLRMGTSAGGARAKALVAYNPVTGEIRSGQIKAPEGFEYCILKFDGVSDSQLGHSKGYGRVEMAYYLMAKEAGLTMTTCRLLEENGRAHFLTQRFDRDHSGEKIHMQSLCGLRHFDYNMVGYYSYEQVFETMRGLKLSYPEAEEMFRRMSFNVMARNCDDHTKNFAFLMDKSGKWSLSPAYDICYAYRPGSKWVSMQSLSVNGKRTDISRQDLMDVAKRVNIRNASNILDKVAAAINRWQEFAKATGVAKELEVEIAKNLQIL